MNYKKKHNKKKYKLLKGPSNRTLVIVLCLITTWTLISVGIYRITERYPEFISKYYSNGLYNIITMPGKYITSIFPFSLGEILLMFLLLFILYYFIRTIIKTTVSIIKKKNRPWLIGLRFVALLLIILQVSLNLFIWGGGLNYNASTIAKKEGYESKNYTPEELHELTIYFINNANWFRSQLDEKADGSVTDNRDFNEICDIAVKGYNAIDGQYGLAEGFFTTAKPAIFSLWMCYTNITGIFPYILPEPIVNTMTPESSLHSTICHEMAHQRAIAREDEANFISFIACMNTKDPYFIYSGYYMAIINCLNSLYSINYELWTDSWQYMSEELRIDINTAGNFWRKFDTPVAEISESVNDTYLQANNIKDGVESYGRLVDLLLAYYNL